MTRAVTLPLKRYQDLLWTVEVEIEGERVDFILDTAAGMTCITPGLADRLGRAPFGRLVGHRMNGDPVSMARCGNLELGIGEAVIGHTTVGVFDLMKLLPPEWPELAGILSLASFRDQPFSIDVDREALTLETANSLIERCEGRPRLPMMEARQMQGFALDLFLALETERGRLWLELDLGNTGLVLLAPHAAELLGCADGDRHELDVAGLGSFVSEVAVKDLIYDGNLGATFFAGRTLSFDLAKGGIWA